MKPFEMKERYPQWVQDLKSLKNSTTVKSVLFNYNRPIEAMFYSDIIAYNSLPSVEIIKNIQAKGYTVFINKADYVPIELIQIQGVKIVTLSDQQ